MDMIPNAARVITKVDKIMGFCSRMNDEQKVQYRNGLLNAAINLYSEWMFRHGVDESPNNEYLELLQTEIDTLKSELR